MHNEFVNVEGGEPGPSQLRRSGRALSNMIDADPNASRARVAVFRLVADKEARNLRDGDRLGAELGASGVLVTDRPDGPRWKWDPP